MQWRAFTLAVGLGAAVLATVPQAVGTAAAVASPPTGEFSAVTPARVLDTRTGVGAPAGQLGVEGRLDVLIAGKGGVPATGVSAVVLNVTAVKATEPTFVTVFPTGQTMPVASTLNPRSEAAVANMAVVALGTDGKVSAYNEHGSVHLLFDVVGYYSSATGPNAARYEPLNPFRAIDTRTGIGGVAKKPLAANTSLRFDFRNRGGGALPATGMTALVLNVTAVRSTASGYLTVFPGDVARPTASSLNFATGKVVPNLVTVRVPTTGIVEFYNSAGSTNLVVDVVGYYHTNRTGDRGRFVPLPLKRSWDTREDGGALTPGDVESFELGGFDGIPLDAAAVALTVTAVAPTEAGYLTVFPDDVCTIPTVSNLNFAAGQTVPNMVITRVSGGTGDCTLGAGRLDIYNPNGTTHVLIDVAGYFMP